MKQYKITVLGYETNVFTDTQGILNIKGLLNDLGYSATVKIEEVATKSEHVPSTIPPIV